MGSSLLGFWGSGVVPKIEFVFPVLVGWVCLGRLKMKCWPKTRIKRHMRTFTNSIWPTSLPTRTSSKLDFCFASSKLLLHKYSRVLHSHQDACLQSAPRGLLEWEFSQTEHRNLLSFQWNPWAWNELEHFAKDRSFSRHAFHLGVKSWSCFCRV